MLRLAFEKEVEVDDQRKRFRQQLERLQKQFSFLKKKEKVWPAHWLWVFHRPPRFSFGGEITTRRGAQRCPLVHIWFDSGWAEPSVQLVISFPSISSSSLISSFHSPFSSSLTQHVTNEPCRPPKNCVCIYITQICTG